MQGRSGRLASGVSIVAGGAIAVARCRSAQYLEDAVLILGLTLVTAWLLQRPHPADRFLASGAVLTGIGGAVVLLRVTHESAYREPAILAGAALALLLLAEVREADVRRGAAAVLAVGAAEALLDWGPTRLDAPDLWNAFLQGWGFGIAAIVYGAVVVAGVVLPGRAGRRR